MVKGCKTKKYFEIFLLRPLECNVCTKYNSEWNESGVCHQYVLITELFDRYFPTFDDCSITDLNHRLFTYMFILSNIVWIVFVPHYFSCELKLEVDWKEDSNE